ncbi:MAG: hypothetical protein EAS51_05055 [Microbacteriaceae bacterium]|nr:MAG: hypothetical protein EAS51_05055 [Microbacteriaceae bacterium]
MAEQPSIDPRYDPAFQRGYSGPVATGSRADAANRVSSAPRVSSALRRHEPEPRGVAAAASPDPGERIGLPPAVPEARDADTAAASEPAVVHVAAPTMRPPWGNPFAIAVALLGIGAFASGVWLLQEALRLVQSETGFQTQLDYWIMQWGMWGGSIFTGVGVLIVAAVLLLCAVYWSRRPHADEE